MYRSTNKITCRGCGRRNVDITLDIVRGKNHIQKLYCPDCHNTEIVTTRIADDEATKENKKENKKWYKR
jgi:CxxC motif-containing protein (DUF1111 family)